MAFLEVEHLKKVYGKNETEVIAVNNVSFKVEKGEFVAIVGQSGSGKSTLLHLMGGVDKQSSGRVYIDGEDLFAMRDSKRAAFRRRKIGIVFQEYNLIPMLNVEENIEMPVRLDGRYMSKAFKEQLLELLGLEKRRRHYPQELSGGQKQRTAIGRAISNHPSIILADEPTGNLDRQSSIEILSLLKKSAEKFSQTLILVTHDINIAAMADRIITISDGSIKSDVSVKHELSPEEGGDK